jgi:hypothetical protein
MAKPWTEEQRAKFRATMAEKNATRAAAVRAEAEKETVKHDAAKNKFKAAKKVKRKSRAKMGIDFPLHVIPARPTPKSKIVVKPKENAPSKIELAIELARAITLLLK